MLQEFPQVHQAGISSVQCTSNGKVLAVTSLDGDVSLYDLTSKPSTPVVLKAHKDSVNSCLFVEGGATTEGRLVLLTASDDKTVRAWDVNNTLESAAAGKDTPQALFFCKGFRDGINKMCLSADQNTVYSACDDGMIVVHDLKKPITDAITTAEAAAAETAGSTPSFSMCDPVYKWMASSQPVNDLSLVRLVPAVVEEEDEQQQGGDAAVSVAPRDVLVTVCDDKALRVWKTGIMIKNEDGSDAEDRMIQSVEEYQDNVNHVEIIGSWVYTATTCAIVALQMDLRTGELNGESRAFAGHQDYVRGCGVIPAKNSTEGDKLITVSDDKTAIEWDIATTEPISGAQLHNDYIMAMCLNKDATVLYTGCEDSLVRSWSLPLPRSHVPAPVQESGEEEEQQETADDSNGKNDNANDLTN